jgi:hypothetical protein
MATTELAAHDLIAADPVRFCERVLGFAPWSKQREILESVRDHPRTAVRSCHGVGKTAAAAHVVLWFLAAYPGCRVISTAPTERQLRDQLWAEIRMALQRAPAGFFPKPTLTRLDAGVNWYAEGISTDTPGRFAGHHAPNLLLVVDEASEIDEDIYRASEGFQTAEGARVLLIGNPTALSGQFYRAFHSERAAWHQIHISAYDSPNLTGESVPAEVSRALIRKGWPDERRAEWGEDSGDYRFRVLGEFPSQADTQVIGLKLIEEAIARTDVIPPRSVDEIVISCDVARFGADETVIAERVGNEARIARCHRGKDTMQTTGIIMELRRDLALRVGDCVVVVDEAGVGGGVVDRLRELGVRVQDFNGARRANDPLQFLNRRSEGWFQLLAALPGIRLAEDPQLTADLVAPTFGYASSGHRVVEPKEKTKQRLGRSPDRADALIMAFAGGPQTGHAWLDVDLWKSDEEDE